MVVSFLLRTFAEKSIKRSIWESSCDHIIVEMQNKSQPYFKNRSVYYVARSISRQGEPGPEWRYDVKAVYLIALLNFKREDISKEFRTDVALMDMKRKTLFSDKVRMVYLQLPFFTKELDECETLFEKLIFVLKHMDVLQRMPWLAQDAVFQKLASIADVASLSKQERLAYDENLRKYRDTIAVMEGQYLEGMEKGEAKGRAEGIKKANIDNARKMKADGMSADLIAKYTGLTIEEIAGL